MRAVLRRNRGRPGIYFRLLLIGYFEGLDSERGMARRAADSLTLRVFLRLGDIWEPSLEGRRKVRAPTAKRI